MGDKTGQEGSATGSNVSTIARLNVALAMDSADFDRGIARAQQSAESLSQKMSKVGAAMSLGVTAPLLGIGGAALKSAGDFEQSMNVLQSVSNSTAGEMATLQAQALSLGASTSFSAGEAAEAMLELGKAGLGATDIMGAMPGVLSLAAAGNMSVGVAAGIAANAVNTFGLEATEVTTVANMLAAAANASSADVEQLAAGFQMSASVFASNGQSMSDLTTAMSLMANAGIAGSDAGTSLKTMLMRLAAPTDEAATAMSALGVGVYNADGSMRPFQDVVADLGTATASLSDAQRNAAFTTIFGADAIRAATILTASGADGWASMETAVTAAGAAQAAADARMRGLNGAMETFKGAIESAMIAVSARFLPVLASIVTTAATLVSGLATLSPELQNAALAFAAVLAAAGPLMLAISGVGAVVGFLLSPIGLVVVGVAALAAAWTANFGGIQEKTATAWAAVQPHLAALRTALEGLPASLVGVQAQFAGFGAQMAVIGANLAAFFAPALGRLQTAFTALPEKLAPILPKLAELGAAFGGLLTALQPLMMVIGAGLAIAAEFGINRLAVAFETLPAILGVIIDQVTATIQLITTVITEVIAGVRAAIDGDWSAVWESAKNIAGAFNTFFRGLFARLGTFMGAVAKNITQPIIDSLDDLGVDIQPILDGIRKTFDDIWAKVLTYIQPVIDLVGTLTTTFDNLKSYLAGLELPNPFAALQSGADAIMGAIGAAGNAVSGGGADGDPSTPGRALGGPVSSGVPYIVGERGPELFIPSRAGQIVPNDELGGWGAETSGGGAASVTLNNYGPVGSEIDIAALAWQVAQLLGRRR